MLLTRRGGTYVALLLILSVERMISDNYKETMYLFGGEEPPNIVQ